MGTEVEGTGMEGVVGSPGRFRQVGERPAGFERGNWDFPGGPVVRSSPANAGYTGSIPGWSGKSPYAMEQLSP